MIIKTEDQLNSAIEVLINSKYVAFDFETYPNNNYKHIDSIDASTHHLMCELEGLALRSESLEPVYIPFLDTEIPRTYLFETLTKLFSQESPLFIAHNIQFDAKIAEHFFGVRPKRKFCTLVGYWYLDENVPKDAKTLGKKHFGLEMVPYKEAKKLSDEEFYEYARRDAEVTYRLYFFLKESLEPSHFELVSTLEMDFLDVLIDMTTYGTCCDINNLKYGEEILTSKALELEAQIYKELGEFNINSSQQLSEKIYGIKIIRKKGQPVKLEKVDDWSNKKYAKVAKWNNEKDPKKKAPSTDEKALSKINTPEANLIKEYRGVRKLLDTYAIGYQKWIIDGKIHPTFNNSSRESASYATVTGRLSCSAPNMMNLPRAESYGWWIRDAIYAEDGRSLIVADEAQLEIRVLAHFSKDENLINAIYSGEDIHLATAKVIFGKDDISKEERSRAKTINFAIIYGESDPAIAEQLGISKVEATLFREQYFAAFPGIKRFVDSCVSSMRRKGYIKTIIGRKRRIPEINSSNWSKSSRAERQTPNAKIQGTASDIVKAAMLHIHKEFKKNGMDAHILLQVHDEIVVECATEIAEEAVAIIKTHMEHPFEDELRVPLEVKPVICKKWSEGK